MEVLYFASLREARGLASERVRSSAADLAGLYR
ncbi:MoaD/ThiS family protein, partial [Xanthomonas sp. Kuri4-2]